MSTSLMYHAFGAQTHDHLATQYREGATRENPVLPWQGPRVNVDVWFHHQNTIRVEDQRRLACI